MSAHVELDFADDGSCTMLSRTEKGGEFVRTQVWPPPQKYKGIRVGVCSGDDMTVTHVLCMVPPDVNAPMPTVNRFVASFSMWQTPSPEAGEEILSTTAHGA